MKSIEKVVSCLNKTLYEHPKEVSSLLKNIFYIKLLNDILRTIDLPPVSVKLNADREVIGFCTLSKWSK